jgi:hypothetical protein
MAPPFMSPSEADLLAARFARINALLKTLEDACSESAEQRETFLKLKQELDDTRRTLRVKN